MNRREFMQCAALLVSGVAATRISMALSDEQKHYLARANYNRTPANYFNEAQRRTVAAVAETIMPATDTPGAIDAGVPGFIENMVQDWLNNAERAIFDQGLAELMASTQRSYGKSFEMLEPAQQSDCLEALESAASDSAWYDFGNTQRVFVSDAPFICQMKELTIWGFFTSEAGATQVLRYEAMPMTFDGNRELGPDDSSWAGTPY
ncbi:gluconate 2-dehydrogenase subunit 3 family protein [Parahaliea mediterranea]|uniref:gluconate 2-dehydrogenase subunit 3 family protein n=1 Tax=Parahaliea mediterranea TaxID=651086 RepID=UPI000E2E8046|nr:gluconate 2-dehydrogenase subunit 3 family protein [Parahaliea mediterranea]